MTNCLGILKFSILDESYVAPLAFLIELKTLSQSQCTKIYITLFESHPCYGITSWGWVPESKLWPLFKIQKNVFTLFLETKKNILINSKLVVE